MVYCGRTQQAVEKRIQLSVTCYAMVIMRLHCDAKTGIETYNCDIYWNFRNRSKLWREATLLET